MPCHAMPYVKPKPCYAKATVSIPRSIPLSLLSSPSSDPAPRRNRRARTPPTKHVPGRSARGNSTLDAQRSKSLAFQTAPIALQTLQIYNTGCERQPVSPLRSTPHTFLSSTTAYRTYIPRLSNEKGRKITYPHSARSAFCAPSLYYRTNRAAAATPAVHLDSCCSLGAAP